MSEYTHSEGTTAPTAPAEKAGIWEDFVDIFYAPSAVFARRQNANAFVPIAIVSILIGVISIVSFDALTTMMEAEWRRATANDPRMAQMTPEQLQAMRGLQPIMAAVAAFLGTPIAVVLVGLVLWMAGKLFDARQTVGAALIVAAYAWVPRVIESVLIGVQARIMDPSQMDGAYRLRMSPARFFDPDTASPIVLALLGRLDLFVIWVTILLAIGLAVTGKISRGKAAIAAIIVWLAGALFPLFGALQARG